MKKSGKIIISILSIVLICAIVFDVTLVNNSKKENKSTLSTTQNVTESTSEAKKTYSDPVEAQARQMVENMTLYEKVGQMLLYYIPKKEDPVKMMARWQFGGYILFSRNFENSTPAKTKSEINEYQSAAKIPAFMAVDEEGGGVNRVSQFSQYRSEPFHSGITNYQKGGWQGVDRKSTRLNSSH